MKESLKRFAATMPERWQYELKRVHYGRQIRRGEFETSEPEYALLPQFVVPGDWAIDVGANIGHYTLRLSQLVGPRGRVIALEPVPVTFSLLAANIQLLHDSNVTLMNVAASDKTAVGSMSVPQFSTGLADYYDAYLSSPTEGAISVLTLALDSLFIDQHIALVKIDAEGHEAFALAGMQELLKRHHPVLIVETGSQEVMQKVLSLDYTPERLPDSPNVLFTPRRRRA